MHLPPPDDPTWVEFVRQSASMVERSWREHGLPLPAGVAEVFSRVGWTHFRQRVPSAGEGTFLNYPGTRLVKVVHQVQGELPGGHDDPAFLEVVGERLRQDLEEYDHEGGDLGASA